MRRTRDFLAHVARASMAHGYAVELRTTSGATSTVRIVGMTNDHASVLAWEDGGSTLTLHFEDGSTMPLEGVHRIARAGD